GINKHTADEVGGWDTTIRRTQYEKLFYNQQSSMTAVDYSSYSMSSEVVDGKRAEQQRTAVKVERPQPKPVVQPQPTRLAVPASPKSLAAPNKTEIDLKTQLEALAVDSTVLHKKFGKGTVVKIDKNEKFIHVKFALGEKKFIFPDAFLMGFLEVK
ncbi:MAG: restriction endonuclease, partial [Bacteroidaceae bacterium]|nr:restriction endonuclease [Bacteroidaceae bacterium]